MPTFHSRSTDSDIDVVGGEQPPEGIVNDWFAEAVLSATKAPSGGRIVEDPRRLLADAF